MPRPDHTSSTEPIPNSLSPAGGGWHCSHLYYSFDRAALHALTADQREAGCRAVIAALDPAGLDAPIRLQSSITSSQKADFGVMALDPNPFTVDRVHQRLMASPLGPALIPRYSFVSITEISEYVQSVDDFGQLLLAGGGAVRAAEAGRGQGVERPAGPLHARARGELGPSGSEGRPAMISHVRKSSLR